MSAWLDTARAVPVSLVARGLELDVRWSGVGPCPACGSAQRGSSDRRLPVGLRRDDAGWRCFACHVGGDGPALVRHSLDDDSFVSVREWFASRRWAGLEDEVASAWPAVVSRYPPAAEVSAVLRAASPVRESASCHDFLARRRLSLDVPAAALPRPSWPGWETLSVTGEDVEGRPRTWWPARWAGLWRLVVPAVDARGRIRSYQARAVRDGPRRTQWPAGCRAGGLLFADRRRARPALRGGPWPEMVLLVEGLTDYLAACGAVQTEDLDIAVLGMTSGSAGALLEARVPAARLVSALDPDEAGDRYHMAVCDLLGPVRRLVLDGLRRPDGSVRRGPDIAEAIAAGARLRDVMAGAQLP